MNFLGRSGAEAEQKRCSIKIVRTSPCTENKIELGILEKNLPFLLGRRRAEGLGLYEGREKFFLSPYFSSKLADTDKRGIFNQILCAILFYTYGKTRSRKNEI